MAVPSPPRLAGERKPSTAKIIVMTVMQKVCAPVPTRTESIIGFCGGRKTSPWTSFQPVSSSTSSAASMALYRLKSRCSVRIRIMATMPERKRTIISELTIENQWICSSPISRYVSQRDAHLMSEISHFTSYVKTASDAPLIPSGVDTAPPQVESCVSAPLHVPEYACLIEDGSTYTISHLPQSPNLRLRDRGRPHLEADDARALKARLVLVELDGDEQVVVEVRRPHRRPWNLGGAAEAERKAQVVDGERLGRVGLVDVLCRGRQVVHHPVHPVVLVDAERKLRRLLLRQLFAAEHFARLVDAHLELVHRIHDAVAAQQLSQVLRHHDHLVGPAEGQRIVLVGKLSLGAR
mmetsp:Transcript_39463/g.127709  ORF Transcript_39463/g.127709 Transcript_39463/m.127709 type:complete len:351 (-) Transcript_39463:161-1213(-)